MLIVEDEVLIRMGAIQMVEDAGFAVVEAGNADEAIQILESRRDICAVFTDINMSGSMDGLQLSHAIRDRWPPIHLVVTSGVIPTGRPMPANTPFLGKPYPADHIGGLLWELLDPHRGPGRLSKDFGGPCDKIA